MTTMRLYETVEALAIMDELLEESQGELTPEIEELLAKAEGDFNDKVERTALKAKSLEAEAAAIKVEADRLAARASARANGAKNLKLYIERGLTAAKKEKVNGLLVSVAMQQNNPAVNVPASFDQDALAELWLADAPGVEVVPPSFKVNKKVVLDRVKAAQVAAVAKLEEEKGGAKKVTDEQREAAELAAATLVLPTGWSVTRSSSLRIR